MPSRAYATEFFANPPRDGACRVCGLSFLRGDPDNERYHRSYHRALLTTFEPKPLPALAKLHAEHGRLVPVNAASPRWISKRMYQFACMLSMENEYSVMWDYVCDGGPGFVFTDGLGRALGGCAVRWRDDYEDTCWVLQWVWVVPAFRGYGLLGEAWSILRIRFDGLIPEPPLSKAAAKFFAGREELPDFVTAYARRVSTAEE